MNTAELTRRICEKYPKVWDRLIKKYLDAISKMPEYVTEYEPDENVIFNILYGLLEDFFEENGIIIDVFYSNYYGGHEDIVFDFSLCDMKKNKIVHASDAPFDLKREAKYQAILKSCEILENQKSTQETN